MANNYSEMSIAFPVTEEQGVWLEAAWKAMQYQLGEHNTAPEGLDLAEIEYPPCVLKIETREDGQQWAWLYTEESVDAEELANVLQQFLKHFDRADGIGIEAALTCSKPRIDEFGGFAIWVTKDNVEAMSTDGWLAEKARVHASIREGEAHIASGAPLVLLEDVVEP